MKQNRTDGDCYALGERRGRSENKSIEGRGGWDVFHSNRARAAAIG